MPDMNKINRLIEVLPDYMVACLESLEYTKLFDDVSEKFELSDEQRDVMEDFIVDIFLGDVALTDVLQKVHELFRFDAEKTKRFTRDIVGEFVVPFLQYFEDGAHILRTLGGDEEEYIQQSTLLVALHRFANKQAVEHIQKIRTLDTTHRRLQLNRIIEKDLIDYVSVADDSTKIALNDFVVDLLVNVENYHTELLHALYENKQIIGGEIRIERDEKTYSPLTLHWLKDFISFSNGNPSTIYIAQYIAQNKNARQLNERDRETLRHVFEIYLTLKLFPESFARIPVERWMVIPYNREEASLKSRPSKEQTLSSPQDDNPPKENSSPSQGVRGAGVVSAALLDLEEHHSSRTILPPELTLPELMAPSASLHSLAPVIVQTRTDSATSLGYEEIHDEFFIDQPKKTFFSGKNYEELADEVLAMSGIITPDSVAHARLQSIVITRLRNIRTAIEIRERLGESAQKGEFGLDTKIADSIVRSANMAADLLAQGVLSIQEIQQEKTSIETDIREIKELVRREFAPEQKKFGRSRVVPRIGERYHIALPPPALILPAFPETASLENISISFKKPIVPPPPQKPFVAPPQYIPMEELVPFPIAVSQDKEESKQVCTVIPSKLSALIFKKALKSVPTRFLKKLSIQEVSKGDGTGVSHKQPHSFFGATDMPHIQHTGLPAFSIEEVDGVPMIVEKQKESRAKESSKTLANILAQKTIEEKKIKEQAAQIELLKKEAQRKAEEEKSRIRAEEEKKRMEEENIREEAEKKKRVAEEEQRVGEEVEKAKKIEAEQAVKTVKDQDASSMGVMPQKQAGGSRSLFSNIFHIPVHVKTTTQQPGKVSFSDIKRSPRLVDTVEELRIFTLEDFRRLSKDPMSAASRIFDKIQSLERESFTKKLTGINAWRENEINILYVQIGQEALLKGKSITTVIDQMKADEKQYLTEEEFDAVLELNERIRM